LTERPRIQEQEFLESQTFINGLGPGVFLKWEMWPCSVIGKVPINSR
jgi:hypothetical protein